jgi:hypothetical protein
VLAADQRDCHFLCLVLLPGTAAAFHLVDSVEVLDNSEKKNVTRDLSIVVTRMPARYATHYVFVQANFNH